MKEPSAPPLGSYSLAGPGTRLNGVYVIDRLIATGGMGQVYVGHTIETADKVAIKMIRPELAQSDTHLALFRKEAAALHRTLHDAIVRYYIFTTDPDLRCPYLAMEFVEGESLADMLERGPLDLDKVRILQRRLAAGLDVAHRAGVVHRDVSPDNIILPDNDPNRAKIIDFGIARDAFGGATLIGGDFAGKSNYVSPEQIGLFGGEVTTKSDIYSLGLTLAAALLGRPLDMGGLPAEMVRKRSSVPDLSKIPVEMRQLLSRMLQPRPEDRPGSMADVASWPTDGMPASAQPVPRNVRRWSVPAAAAAFALVGVGIISVISIGYGPHFRKSEGSDPSRPGPAQRTVEALGDAPPPPVEITPQPPQPSPNPPPPGALPAALAQAPPSVRPDRAAAAPVPELELLTQSPSASPPVQTSGPDGADAVAGLVARPTDEAASVPEPSAPGAFRDCRDCPELIALEAGALAMGSNADPSERPIHKVTILPFAVGRLPVTVGEWRLCVAAKGCKFDPGGDPDAPVHNISWDDAAQYVDWLSRLTGRRYRMLSEAEWEYAARANTKTRYWWGDQFRPDMSSCHSCVAKVSPDPPKAGLFPPNAFGLHDVTGSVSQWVADCWHKNFKGAPTDGSAWDAPGCAARVLRGGSWTSVPGDLRITNREFYDPAVRYPGHGLRVGRDL